MVVPEPETFQFPEVGAQSLRRSTNSIWGAQSLVAESETVTEFTAWVVTAREALLKFVVLAGVAAEPEQVWMGRCRA